MIKRFSPELYKENDQVAKESLRSILKDSKIYKIEDNPKKRGVDLFAFQGDKHAFNIEVEIKRVWKKGSGKTFPYADVQFPERKEKYAKLEQPTLFVMFNEDQSQYLAVTGKDLLDSPKVEVRNKYVFSGEKFFKVDKSKVFFNDINGAITRLTKIGKVLYE